MAWKFEINKSILQNKFVFLNGQLDSLCQKSKCNKGSTLSLSFASFNIIPPRRQSLFCKKFFLFKTEVKMLSSTFLYQGKRLNTMHVISIVYAKIV